MIDYCSGLACYAFYALWVILSPLSALYFKYYLFYYSGGDYNTILKDISSSRFFEHNNVISLFFSLDFSGFFIFSRVFACFSLFDVFFFSYLTLHRIY